jgi:hypothetical protein
MKNGVGVPAGSMFKTDKNLLASDNVIVHFSNHESTILVPCSG